MSTMKGRADARLEEALVLAAAALEFARGRVAACRRCRPWHRYWCPTHGAWVQYLHDIHGRIEAAVLARAAEVAGDGLVPEPVTV